MNTRKRIATAFVAALGALAVSGGALQASDTDDRIEASAKKTYVFKTYLKDDDIKTVSKDGVVVLTGTVSESGHRTLAENTIQSLPGVVSVDNQLIVKGEVEPEHSDAWVSTKVKTALLFHRHVSASATDVYVKDGVVSLRGVATSSAQLDLVTEYARDVEGVKSVVNEMTISKEAPKKGRTAAERIDDASVTAQVRSTLMSHRSTSNARTMVQTRDGVVTLTGVAKNEAEKSLVTKLVEGVHGVEKVVNGMTIAVPVAGN